MMNEGNNVDFERAYSIGYMAASDIGSAASNPYDEIMESEEYAGWNEGYDAAMEDAGR